MIRLEHLCKRFVTGGVLRVVADGINLTLPPRRAIALLGRNGAGKSSLMRMIAGTMAPTSGRVHVTGSVSWPVGFAGHFHPEMTGAQTARFVARTSGVDTDMLQDIVGDLAGLGPHYTLPVGSYSAGMKARLAFALSMGIHFDTYLVDEVTSVGDAAFREKSQALLLERLKHSGAIVVSHSMPVLRGLCTMGAVLEAGRLTLYDDLEEAIALHMRQMAAG
ncbi:ABC transporter ATP-binding protein [Halodurantibacterium flavum]|uniref:ABC transporter ATP-binding protein n=1 Tax=Halodurantibacterium flavum TaxID=1382802 RepID=A0ABW4S617_9RHOB